jgi:DNA polymerase/3'-5' exonuclease PolX
MKLDDAQVIAEQLAAILRPHCQRIEIAGSVRREKAEPNDIEICAIPLLGTPIDMFGLPQATPVSMLDEFNWSSIGKLALNGPRQKKIALDEGINLDLFIVLPGLQDWGLIYTIRTGPAEFSHWCVTQRKRGGGLPSDCVVDGGRVWRGGEHVPMPEEIDFLNFLGLGWIDPKDRQPGWMKA